MLALNCGENRKKWWWRRQKLVKNNKNRDKTVTQLVCYQRKNKIFFKFTYSKNFSSNQSLSLSQICQNKTFKHQADMFTLYILFWQSQRSSYLVGSSAFPLCTRLLCNEWISGRLRWLLITGLCNLMWGHKTQSLQNSITTLASCWLIVLVQTQATARIHRWSAESSACGTDYVSACSTFHVCVFALKS